MRIRTIAVAALAAAAVVYLFDPIAGNARRKRLRERITAFAARRAIRERAPLPENMVSAPAGEIAAAPEEQPSGGVADMPDPPPSEDVADMPEPPPSEDVADAPKDVADSPKDQPPKDQPRRDQPPRDQPMDDAAIAGRIRMKMVARPDLETRSLVINVVRGVAFLRGELTDRQQVDQIVDLTGSVPGVKGVQNLIHLPESETITRPISSPLGDAWNG